MNTLSKREQALFLLLNEIGIISQLSGARLDRLLPHGLTLAQFGVLNHLVRLDGDWSPARLAAAFQVTKGTMTSTLQRLASKGFIEIRRLCLPRDRGWATLRRPCRQRRSRRSFLPCKS